MRIPNSLRSFLAALFALALVAAACGDDASPIGDLATGEAETEEEDQPESDGEDEGADEDAADPQDDDQGEDDGAEPDDGDAESPVDPPDGGDSSAYCALAIEQEALEDSFDPVALSPEEVRDYYTEGRARLAEATEIAPEGIRTDLQRTLAQLDQIIGVLEANDWDVFAALDDLEAIADDPAMDAVDERLDVFDAEVCGIEPDVGDEGEQGAPPIDPDDPFASPEAFEAILGSETGRQLFAEGMAQSGDITIEQASCLIDNLDLEALFLLGVSEGEPTAEDLAGLFNAFDVCGITPDQFLG